MTYQILNDAGEVINTIVADEAFVEAHYSGRYRLVTEPEIVVVELAIITKVAFRFRMTDAEYVGILSAAKTDMQVAAWVETFNMVSQIDLNNQRTKDGVFSLVNAGLLTEARAKEILTASVQSDEKP